MPNSRQKKHDLSNLNRLLDYAKYLYEEENRRNEKLTSATNIYLVVITFAFTFLAGLVGVILPKNGNTSQSLNEWIQVALWVCLGVSILLILLSLVFTMLVIKVRSFQRLCNPKDFVIEAEHFENEEKLIGSIISHFVVATERNFLVNNQKAKFLSYGLQSYVIGFVILLLTVAGFYLFRR